MKWLFAYLYVCGMAAPTLAFILYWQTRWLKPWFVERFRVVHQKLDDIERRSKRTSTVTDDVE